MADSLKTQLGRINARNVKMWNGLTIRQNLEGAVDYLYDCVDNFIQEYYLSYDPERYIRTFDFQDSLYAEDFIHARVNGNRIELSISFRPSMAYHRNIFGDHMSYVPLLINSGWHSKKLEIEMGVIPRFTVYEGYHFIEKAIQMFNRTNPYGVYISPDDVDATWEGYNVSHKIFNWMSIDRY